MEIKITNEVPKDVVGERINEYVKKYDEFTLNCINDYFKTNLTKDQAIEYCLNKIDEGYEFVGNPLIPLIIIKKDDVIVYQKSM